VKVSVEAFSQIGLGRWEEDRLVAKLTLENLEVGDVRIFGVYVELYAGHGDIKEDAVVHLAESSAVGGQSVSANVAQTRDTSSNMST